MEIRYDLITYFSYLSIIFKRFSHPTRFVLFLTQTNKSPRGMFFDGCCYVPIVLKINRIYKNEYYVIAWWFQELLKSFYGMDNSILKMMREKKINFQYFVGLNEFWRQCAN